MATCNSHLHAELLILSESQCENYENKSFVLQEGEAFYFMPDDFEDNPPAGQFTWYKTNTMNNSKIESISFDEKERIHYHGGAIFFLNLLSEDSGIYTHVVIQILKCSHSIDIPLSPSVVFPNSCHVTLFEKFFNFTVWDFFCPGCRTSVFFKANMQLTCGLKMLSKIMRASTPCICTWTHNHTVYNTSGSRWLKVKGERAFSGYGIKLNCSVFCGTNAKRECNASWRINGVPFNGWKQGYSQNARLYDAYVVYQTQCLDKATEDTQCRFVTQTLPSVLEEKCGYRLFIHGRDDIPGEDHLELVEDSMRQSRRLIVILTPGSGSGSEITAMPQNFMELEGFDWQVGLHHALVQREMSVILIQLGDTGPHGYTHLPIGLQHLIRKSAPLRWPEGSRGAAAMNSRFWKRVRYLMPATPAKKCPQSAIV
uniref:TIR domain-containing protein n=1 Tax=Lates calcarifer TaxID=8187 RepID=A0A4W6DUE7_LATCA